jgi:glucose dehydrogenase
MPSYRIIGLSLCVMSCIAVGLLGGATPSAQQPKAGATPAGAGAASEWRGINGDMNSTRYAPLSQIDASNFERLTVAWQWKGAD